MTDTRKPAWYRRPAVLAVIGLLVLAAGVGVGLWLSSGEDDGNQVDTTDTTGPAHHDRAAADHGGDHDHGLLRRSVRSG